MIFPLHLETPVPEHDQVILRPQHLKTFVLDYDLEILRPKRAIPKSEVYVTKLECIQKHIIVKL